MRVLAITDALPLPLDWGTGVRIFGLTRALADKYDVHLLAGRRENTTSTHVDGVKEMVGGPVEVFDRGPSPRSGGAAAIGRWSKALWSGVSPWVANAYVAPLAERAKELAPGMDAVVLLDDYCGVYAAELAELAPVVCDKSNVAGSSAAEVDAHGLPDRARKALDVHLSRRFERAYLAHAAATVVTSPEESKRLEKLYGRGANAVVPSAVDIPAQASERRGTRNIGWLGDHSYGPNVQGLERFVREAWEPLGRDGYRLLVAGGNAPDAVRALGRFPGVEVLGYVDDLDHLFADLAAAVVPLWQGAGVKVKTLTFMAAGIPVTGTPVALEGIEAEDGHQCLIASEPAGLADAARRLVDDSELGARIGSEGRRLVIDGYTWEQVGPRFAEVVKAVVDERTPA
jgi:glycosyltransferase involved in cell wall biosynthesis